MVKSCVCCPKWYFLTLKFGTLGTIVDFGTILSMWSNKAKKAAEIDHLRRWFPNLFNHF